MDGDCEEQDRGCPRRLEEHRNGASGQPAVIAVVDDRIERGGALDDDQADCGEEDPSDRVARPRRYGTASQAR